jgi:hypothetical protein
MHSNYGRPPNSKKKDWKKPRGLKLSNRTSKLDSDKLCIFAYSFFISINLFY